MIDIPLPSFDEVRQQGTGMYPIQKPDCYCIPLFDAPRAELNYAKDSGVLQPIQSETIDQQVSAS